LPVLHKPPRKVACLTFCFEADAANRGPLECRLYICAYEQNDVLTRYCSSPVVCEPGSYNQLNWTLTEPKSAPIANVGIEVSGMGEIDAGTILIARGMDGAGRSDSELNELTYIDMDTFLANF